MLGLLGLRIFEASEADVTDLGEEHGNILTAATSTCMIFRPLDAPPGRPYRQNTRPALRAHRSHPNLPKVVRLRYA
jgi:hypothetical protein